MNFVEQRKAFEAAHPRHDSVILAFRGVEPGYDVYNCSIPFTSGGRRYIYGRVEPRADWANSHVRLFEEIAPDVFEVVQGARTLPLEDPFVQSIGGELVLGGTHVRKLGGEIDTYYCYFYRGKDPFSLTYFTTGPDYMKDIRLVELPSGKIGVFTRPRGEETLKQYGTESVVGYVEIDSLDDLLPANLDRAKIIEGLFEAGEWGGCNQAYLLKDGRIGLAAHKAVNDGVASDGQPFQLYTNCFFIFDPATRKATPMEILATDASYPAFSPKVPKLAHCIFTSGLVFRPDGKADLYTGLGDAAEGRVTIPAPFDVKLPLPI
ncbi:MAG: DUF1861 family protein [Kiritimatiellia bacterium]|jgi:hypothetical protein